LNRSSARSPEPRRIAVVGGDARDAWVAVRLAEDGHVVRLFGASPSSSAGRDLVAATLEDTVQDADWLVLPGPGLTDETVLYAPHHHEPIMLSEDLLGAASLNRGGLILGRSSPALQRMSATLGFGIFESKDERDLAIANATGVGEGLLRLLIERTDRVLPEYRTAVVGYGAVGEALTGQLLALRVPVTVVARDALARARARQRGAEALGYADRASSLLGFDVVLNTVPSQDAVPAAVLAAPGDRLVVDLASPPGGLDHASVPDAARVVWARGLGARSPLTSGDIRFGYVERVIAGWRPHQE
jgi:dipicolinate synthase subunit A